MAKWGAFRWHTTYTGTPTKWSTGYRPFDYRVILLDTNGNILRILRENVDTITWDYDRNGGCGDLELNLRSKFDAYGLIEADYEVQVWVIPPTGANYQKVYSGYVYDKTPSLTEKEGVVVRCTGYSAQLDRIVVRRDDGTGTRDLPYNHVQISANADTGNAIVNDIIKNHVAPATGIIFDHTLIDEVTYTPDDFEVGDTAEKLIKELASLAGNYEWGVNKDKKFFFKQKSTTRGYNFIVGGNVVAYKKQESYSQIKNRVVLKVKGKTTFVLERSTDLAVDQMQDDDSGGWVSFGTTTQQKLKQKFLPNTRSLSKVEFQAQCQGFHEYISDGDMEEYSIAAWDVHGATTYVGKAEEPALGDLSLKVVTVFPGMAPTKLIFPLEGYGAAQQVLAIPNENYRLTYYYYITQGDFFVQIWDLTNDSLLIESERYTSQNTWYGDHIDFSIGEYTHDGPLDIEVRLYSCLNAVSTFYVDNVSLKPVRDGVKVSVREENETDELNWYVLDQEDWTGSISVWLMHYPLDRSKIHDLVFERTRALAGYGFNNSNYYQLKRGA